MTMMEGLTTPLLADKDESVSSLGETSEGFFSAVENDEEQGAIITNNNEASRAPDDENDHHEDITSSSSRPNLLHRILHTPLLPDFDRFDNLKAQIRFVKFLLVTIFGIAATHWTVLWMVRLVRFVCW